MKIYNISKKPQGVGYDDVDYDAIYQSGFTAGYGNGYEKGVEDCHRFVVSPLEFDLPISSSTSVINVEGNIGWYIDTENYPLPDWLQASTLSGVGNGSITLITDDASCNCGSSARSTVVRVMSDAGDYYDVAVEQLSRGRNVLEWEMDEGTPIATQYLPASGGNVLVNIITSDDDFKYLIYNNRLYETVESAGTVPHFAIDEVPEWAYEQPLTMDASGYSNFCTLQYETCPCESRMIYATPSAITIYQQAPVVVYEVNSDDLINKTERYYGSGGGQYDARVVCSDESTVWAIVRDAENVWNSDFEYLANSTNTHTGSCSSITLDAEPWQFVETETGKRNYFIIVKGAELTQDDPEVVQKPTKYRTGNHRAYIGNPAYWEAEVESAATPVAQILKWQFYDSCLGTWSANYIASEVNKTIISRVSCNPVDAVMNLVFSTDDSSIASIDSAGTIVCGPTPFQETTITVTDTISNLSVSKDVVIDSVPYIYVLEPNDCPCNDVEYHNDCRCVPASGGTYHNNMVFHAPWQYNMSEVHLVSKPDWVTITPTQQSGCSVIDIRTTFTVAPNTGAARSGWVEYIANDISGLTGDFFIEQDGASE